MLIPRFSRARRLALWFTSLVWLGVIAAAGFGGCQGPDTFLRKDDATGGFGGPGVGGTGYGGFIGGPGTGGFSPGTGGATGAGGVGTGGRVGTGGTPGTGGRSDGGVVGTGGTPGTGGRSDGGVPDVAGTGGMVIVGTGGAPAMDAGNDADGAVIGGTGPCAGLCAPAVSFVSNPNYNSPNFMLGAAACYETTSPIRGGGCSNCGGRSHAINGMPVSVTGWPSQLPAPVRGGFCIQIGIAGTGDGGALDYASFYTFD